MRLSIKEQRAKRAAAEMLAALEVTEGNIRSLIGTGQLGARLQVLPWLGAVQRAIRSGGGDVAFPVEKFEGWSS